MHFINDKNFILADSGREPGVVNDIFPDIINASMGSGVNFNNIN